MKLLIQQLKLALSNPKQSLSPLLFFGLVILLFPLALGALPDVLASVAPGLVWIAALLASLLALESLFRADYEDGTLELWLASRGDLLGYVWIRLIIHWLLYALPLVLIAPFLAYAINLPVMAFPVLLLSLCFGTLALVWIGGVAMALTTGLQYNGFLLALLTLPFYVPVLIFGAGAVEAAAQGWNPFGALYLLAALAVLSLLLAPFAIAASLKMSFNQ